MSEQTVSPDSIVDWAKDQDRVMFYFDKENEIRWRYLSAGNGKTLADSGEGYSDLDQAVESCSRVVNRLLVSHNPFPNNASQILMLKVGV